MLLSKGSSWHSKLCFKGSSWHSKLCFKKLATPPCTLSTPPCMLSIQRMKSRFENDCLSQQTLAETCMLSNLPWKNSAEPPELRCDRLKSCNKGSTSEICGRLPTMPNPRECVKSARVCVHAVCVICLFISLCLYYIIFHDMLSIYRLLLLYRLSRGQV